MIEQSVTQNNAENDLKRDLQSPVRTVRLFAFDQILRTGTAGRLREFLKERESLEDDEECLILLNHALAMAVEAPPETVTTGGSPENPTNHQPRKTSLAHRTSDEWKELAEGFPDSISGEDNPMILAELITRLGKHLEPTQCPQLEKLLTHSFSSVRSAALTVLIERFPDRVATRLPHALKSRDPRLRALAIRGLARIDPFEACRHMELLLLGTDPGLRRYGLQAVALFPFPPIRDLLVRFVLIADEPVLLRGAAAIFRSNPDPELPFRLLEAQQQATGNRKAIIRKMFDNAFQALKTSGILGDGLAAYLKQLEEWVRRQNTQNRVKEIFAHISEETSDPAQVLADLMGDKIEDQGTRKTLQESLAWDLPDFLKSAIRKLLDQEPHSPQKVSPGQKALPTTSGPELERHLAKLCISTQTPEARGVVTKILDDEKAPLDQRILGLRAATNWAMRGFEELAERWLCHSDPRVLSGALEYLTETDPERVYPKLGHFLAAASPLVRLRAILLLKRYDLPQAVSSLFALIRQQDARTDRLLATSLVQFEFPLLRNPLTDFLCQTNGCMFLKEALCLFQANPAPENLFCLFRIERAVGSLQANQVRKVSQASEAILLELGMLTPERIAKANQDWEAELARLQAKAAKPPPYSLEQVFPDGSQSAGFHLLDSLRGAVTHVDRSSIRNAIVALLIFAPLFYAYWAYVSNTEIRFSLSSGLRPTWQRLARPSSNATSHMAPPVTPSRPANLSSPEEDFFQAQARETLRERSLQPPIGMGLEGQWMMQAAEHPLVGAGLQSAELGREDEAIKLLEQALADSPDNPYLQVRVLSALCHLYQMRGDENALKKAQARFVVALDNLPSLFSIPFREFLNDQGKFLDSLKIGMHSMGTASGVPQLSSLETTEGARQINLFLSGGADQPNKEDSR